MDPFEGLTDALRFGPKSNWTTTIALTLLLIFLSTYVSTAVSSALTVRSTKDGKEPPVVPYFLPFIGNTIAFARDPASFVAFVT